MTNFPKLLIFIIIILQAVLTIAYNGNLTNRLRLEIQKLRASRLLLTTTIDINKPLGEFILRENFKILRLILSLSRENLIQLKRVKGFK